MKINILLKAVCASVLGLGLAACAIVPGSTLLAMSAMDPLEIDPGDIAVAVRTPVGYELSDGRVVFSLTVRNLETDETIDVSDAMALREGALPTALLRREKPGTRIWIFGVSPKQRDAILAARETALAWETTGDNSREMSIGVGARPCLASGANPFQEAKYTIFLQSSPGGDWMTLVRESNYVDLLRESGIEGFEGIEPCDPVEDGAEN